MTARKQGWERSRPFVALDDATLEHALAQVDPVLRLSSAQPLREGLSNSSYRLRCTDGRQLILRVCTRGQAQLDVQLGVLPLLEGRVAAPRLLGHGRLETPEGQPFLLLSWCPGVTFNAAVDRGEPVEELARAIAQALAQLHEIELPAPGVIGPQLCIEGPLFPGERPYLNFIRDALAGVAGEHLGAELRARIERFVTHMEPVATAMGTQRKLVHADFDGTNVVLDRVDGELRVTGVLDWEFAYSGPAIVDLSSMVRQPENLPPDFDRALVASLRERGVPVPERWLQACRYVDLLAYCNFLCSPDATARAQIFGMVLEQSARKMDELGF